MLTRVTVPIDYRDPTLVATVSIAREKLEASGTPKKKIDEEISEIVRNWKGKPSAWTVSFMGSTLLSHSAQKIYLIDLGNRLDESVMSALPDFLKPRIEWVDRDHKISNSVFEMLEPVGNDLDKVWKKNT
jgi:hypothetical protein